MLRSSKALLYALALVPMILLTLASLPLQRGLLNDLEVSLTGITGDAVLDLEKARLKTVMDSVEGLLAPYVAQPGTEGMAPALAQMQHLNFDDGKGYLFAYDASGTRMLLGSKTGPENGIGQNYWSLQDQEGQYMIQDLIRVAKDGSGYYSYYFPKPGESQASEKFAYAIWVEKWNLMLGTGFYIDSLDQVVGTMHATLGEQQATSWRQSLLIGLGFTVLIALGASFAVRAFIQPLTQLRNAFQLLAQGEGDLTKKLPDNRIDILDEIAQAFNRFLDSLREDIRALQHSSTELTAIASQARQSREALNANIERQHLEATQIATAVDQMAATSSEIASSAEVTRTSADDANQGIGQVQSEVSQSESRMQELNDLMLGVETSTQELASSVTEINAALEVIQGLSEQTNLLSLNAAIEAARAGEQGRGFAVVADEVRNLAQRSQQSTVEIGTILETLHHKSAQTTQHIADSSEKRRNVIDAMTRINQVMSTSTDSVKRLVDMNFQVANAATEQSAVSDDVAKRVSDIALQAEAIGAGAEQTGQQAVQIDQLASNIKTITEKFRIDTHR